MSNSLDPDQAGHFVGSDLSSNCLQRLSAENHQAIIKGGGMVLLITRNTCLNLWVRKYIQFYVQNFIQENQVNIVISPTVLPAKSDSDIVFYLQLFSKSLTCTIHLC